MSPLEIAQFLGSVGEFLGAIAVVVTLVYLARQVHSSSEATKALVRQGVAEFSMQYVSLRVDSAALVEAYRKVRSGEALSDEETDLLLRHQQFNFAGFEGVYSNYKRGFFDEDEWRVYENRIRGLFRHNPTARRFWEQNGGRGDGANRSWEREFAEKVDAILDEVQASLD